MRLFLVTAALAAATTPASPQQNPFKLTKAGLKGAQVTYAMGGDVSGTATVSFDGQRVARRSTISTKMMGKTTNTDDWSLVTPDSSYRADLTKKQGTAAPNLLPYMARAYDDLDGAGKTRLHQNMQEMAGILSRAFNLGSLNSGEKAGTKTYAGQECEERTWGAFSVCTMTKAPISLHTSGGLVCFRFEETATEVKLAAPGADAFTPPAGITWKQDGYLTKPDSMAKGYVNYLASQALADSLAKAKAELEAAQKKSAGTGAPAGQPTKMTPEQEAQMQQACEAIKNFDLNIGKAIADAANQALKELADEAKRAAEDAAKNAAKNKLKGLFKKPKIP